MRSEYTMHQQATFARHCHEVTRPYAYAPVRAARRVDVVALALRYLPALAMLAATLAFVRYL